jgi:hypothetical protein
VGNLRRKGLYLIAGALTLSLAGCSGFFWDAAPTPAPAPVVVPPSVGPEALLGSWGLASYRKEADRARTEKEAHAQCNRPYIIKLGPNGGLMMNLADQKETSELVLKGSPDGKTYLGLPGDVGTPDDRVISAVGPDSFTADWVDPDNATRYGTMIYVRCKAKAH